MTAQLRWLASYPKSGNTWVRLVVACYLTGGDSINWLPEATAQSDLRPYDYQCLAPFPLEKLEPASVTALRPAVLEHKRWLSWHLLKTHHVNLRVNGVDLIPGRITDRAVYLVRDPRDVAPSLATHIEVEPDRAADLVNSRESIIAARECPTLCHYVGSWSRHVESWENAHFPTLIVRYEDLVEQPERNFRAILEFLGFEVEGDRLEAALTATDKAKLIEKERSEGFRDAYKGPFFDRTHEPLSEDKVREIEDAHAGVMERYGYE